MDRILSFDGQYPIFLYHFQFIVSIIWRTAAFCFGVRFTQPSNICCSSGVISTIAPSAKNCESVIPKPSHNFNIDSQHLDFDNEFDIVTAVQSHHYLDMESRKTATKHCYQALKQSGIYITFENIALSVLQSEVIGIERWKQFLASNGKTTEEIKSHVSRRGTEVFPITVEQHIKLLRECGFGSVDILWASYMQAGFWAIK